MAEKIQIGKKEPLYKAAEKINSAIDEVNTFQTQIDQLVVEGDSSVEAAQARVDTDGVAHTTLKERLDVEHSEVTAQLAQTENQIFIESMVSRKEAEGLYISWVDDDGYAQVYDQYKPLMLDYNIPISSALMTERLGNGDSTYLSIEQIKELAELGMEFMSHTHWNLETHRPIDMTEEELDEDFRTSQQIIKNLGLNHKGLVLPFGDNSPLIQKVARRYFDYVIGTGVVSKAGKVLYPGEIDNYYITRVTLEQGFDYVKERLDEAHQNGIGWIVFVSHAQYDWYSDAYCRQVLDYAVSLGFKFCNTEEGVKRFGNIAQFGKNRIGADGSVNANDIGKLRHRPHVQDVYYHDTPITEFPKNVITFSEIPTQYATEFPLSSAGLLYTHRYDSDAYSFQKYVTSRNYKVFTRNWNTTNNNWGMWIETDIVQYLGMNGISAADSPNATFLQNKISFTQIGSGQAQYFPEKSSGLLINYAHETGDTFPYQEYQIFRNAKTYRRYWTSSGWTEWDVVGAVRQMEDNSKNGTNAIGDFKEGISMVNITGAGDPTGLPENYGTLTTYKHSNTTIGYNYQEFKGLNSYNKYIRHVKSDGTWNVWRRYVTEAL